MKVVHPRHRSCRAPRRLRKHRGAYQRIFARMGLDAVGVEASSRAMGGSNLSSSWCRDAGEDWIVTCSNCDYRANVEGDLGRGSAGRR